MAKCETCGNDYNQAFTITMRGQMHVFDSFECAISALAPTCRHCGVRILGYGVEADGAAGAMFCSAHCANNEGIAEAKDHV